MERGNFVLLSDALGQLRGAVVNTTAERLTAAGATYRVFDAETEGGIFGRAPIDIPDEPAPEEPPAPAPPAE